MKLEAHNETINICQLKMLKRERLKRKFSYRDDVQKVSFTNNEQIIKYLPARNLKRIYYLLVYKKVLCFTPPSSRTPA